MAKTKVGSRTRGRDQGSVDSHHRVVDEARIARIQGQAEIDRLQPKQLDTKKKKNS